MIVEMSPLLFVHIALSLVGIASGLVVLHGLLTGSPHGGWTAVFLATTVLTSVTGFPLPATQLLPSHIVGVLSLVLLAVAIVALYGYHLAGAWRWIYVLTALISLYLNVFVLVIQSFLKVPALHALAPSVPPAEPPFAVAQGIVLVFFVIVIIGVIRRYRPAYA